MAAPPNMRGVPSPTISDFVVSGQSMVADGVSRNAATRDGEVDGVFDVTVTGQVVAFVLLTVDATGSPSGAQQWDTIKVPASIGAPLNSQTWVLGVEEGRATHNFPDGTIPVLAPGPHRLRLYASNSGWFKKGSYFRLYAVGANGVAVASAVLAY
jgi:hypothetical protein